MCFCLTLWTNTNSICCHVDLVCVWCMDDRGMKLLITSFPYQKRHLIKWWLLIVLSFLFLFKQKKKLSDLTNCPWAVGVKRVWKGWSHCQFWSPWNNKACLSVGISGPPSGFWHHVPAPDFLFKFVTVGSTTSCQRWQRKRRKRKRGLYCKPTDCELRPLKR